MTEAWVTDKRGQRLIVGCVAFAAFMCTLDTYVVNVSLPAIARSFQVGTGAASWVVLAYLLVLTGAMLPFGKLEDTYGVKPFMVLGYVTFSAGSFLCGISPNLTFLVLSRAVQGLGGAMLYTCAFALVAKVLPRAIRGWAFGLIGTFAALGYTVGAPLGGFITSYASWHWIFLVNVPVGLLAALSTKLFIPDDPRPPRRKSERLDIPGFILSFLGLSALLSSLSMGGELGWNSPGILAGFALFIAAGALFLIREQRVGNPLLDLGLFRNKPFTLAIGAAFFGVMLMGGSAFLIPFYLVLAKGLSEDAAGVVILTYSLVYMFAGPLAGKISDRFPPTLLCAAGMLSATACCLFFALSLGYQGMVPVLVYLPWLGLSFGFFLPPNNKLVMGLSPEGKLGGASSVFKTFSSLSVVLGVCLFETLYSQAIPRGGGGFGADAPARVVDPGALIPGFRAAFLFGACLTLTAMVLSLVVRIYTRKQEPV